MSGNTLRLVLCLLLVAQSALVWTVLVAARRLIKRADASQDRAEVEHAKCMALIAQYVGDEFASRVLIAAADRLTTTEGVAEFSAVGVNRWSPNSRMSVPEIWLRQRAAQLHKADDDG